MAASQAKAKLIDLYPQDYEAIARIRERLELSSDALAIRQAIRSLSRRLIQPALLHEQQNKPTQGEKNHE